MGEFVRARLPDPVDYFARQDVSLRGPGRWKTGPCHFHGGSDSLRVNVLTGAWRCMNCGAKGGDVLAYEMQAHCLDFVAAARALNAYRDDGSPHRGPVQAQTLAPRDAMQLAAQEVLLALVVIAGVRKGQMPSTEDWQRYLKCASRLELLAQEYRT